MDDDGNWHRVLAALAMTVQVHDLVTIGVVLGPELAERMYRALHEEPRTAHGDRIDWVTILREIQRQAPRDRYGGKGQP